MTDSHLGLSVFFLSIEEGERMLLAAILVIALIGGVIPWVISIHRKLVILNESLCNAMSQIGVQLSSRFDALTALLYRTKHYANDESELLIETIQLKRRNINANSTPRDVALQEQIIEEVLQKILNVSKQYVEIQSDEALHKTMDAMQAFENMLKTSRLIYNDSVTKFNKEIRVLPVLVVAKLFGFSKKDYLIML